MIVSESLAACACSVSAARLLCNDSAQQCWPRVNFDCIRRWVLERHILLQKKRAALAC